MYYYVNHSNMSIWYPDANKLYGYAMMQKLPYKDFIYTSRSLYEIMNAPDDIDHGYYIFCDINYTNSCKDLALMPNKRKINDIVLSYKERENRENNLRSQQQNRIKASLDYAKVLCQDGCKND